MPKLTKPDLDPLCSNQGSFKIINNKEAFFGASNQLGLKAPQPLTFHVTATLSSNTAAWSQGGRRQQILRNYELTIHKG